MTRITCLFQLLAGFLLQQASLVDGFVIHQSQKTSSGDATRTQQQSRPSALTRRFAESRENNDDDDEGETKKKDLISILGELDKQFDYEGRMDAKSANNFRCGFVVIIGVSLSRLVYPLFLCYCVPKLTFFSRSFNHGQTDQLTTGTQHGKVNASQCIITGRLVHCHGATPDNTSRYSWSPFDGIVTSVSRRHARCH